MYKIKCNILIIIILSLLFGISNRSEAAEKKFTVVIDAGHGGKDVGATDNGVMEKNINLKVARQLEALIKKKLKNTNVVMTRDNDTYLTLQQRADKANKAQGDIFISIHTNSVDKKNRNRKNIAGSSVYTLGLHKDDNNLAVAMRENSVIELETDYEQKYSGFDPQKDESYIIFEMAQKKNLSQSIRFAENIEKELVKAGRENRGVHQAGFWVLWATSMPAVLVELDFICNPESAKYMTSDKGAKELAEAIFNAVKAYEASWKKNYNIPSNQSLSDTYSEDENDSLEESFTLAESVNYTKAKKRIQQAEPIKERQSQDKRKRRSLRAKELSSSKSYEETNLRIPDIMSYEEVKTSKEDKPVQLVAAETGSSKENNKSKKKKENTKNKNKEGNKKENIKSKDRKKEAHNARINKLITVYKIQILASADLLNQDNSRFCGLSPISTYKENNLYKYYYGESSDRSELEAILTDVRKKIPDAFIVSSQKTIQNN